VAVIRVKVRVGLFLFLVVLPLVFMVAMVGASRLSQAQVLLAMVGR
jgi:hypothetical protein